MSESNMLDISKSTEAASSSFDNLQKSASDNMNQFSTAGSAAPGAKSDFLASNGLIAKFGFLILAIIVFLVLVNLGIRLLYYFINPKASKVKIINGMIDGNNLKVFTQDPATDSMIIYRSNDQTSGIEFSWSVWLMITGFPTETNTTAFFQPVFVKGGGTYNRAGVSAISNGPGVYISSGKIGSPNTIRILMDTVSEAASNSKLPSPEIIDISNVPINKWFSLIVRCQNKYLDAYINGIVVHRSNLLNVPLQNYNSVEVCGNGGFIGKLSDLTYFNRALNIIDINGIVYLGPDTKNADPSVGDYGGYYLSNLWYS
jgi:hypothetical protein